MIQVIDNALPSEFSDEIENELLGQDFNWFLKPEVTSLNSSKPDKLLSGFNHSFVTYSNITSPYAYKYLNVPYTVCNKLNIQIKNITQARAWLLPPSPEPGTLTKLHTDQSDRHLSLLYYVNDCDGETIFKDLYRQQPVKNTAVLFDGRIPHQVSTPSHWRSVLNFVLEFDNIDEIILTHCNLTKQS